MRHAEAPQMNRVLAIALVSVACRRPPSVHDSVTVRATVAPIAPPVAPLANLDVATRFADVDTGRYGNQISVVGGLLVAQHYATLTPPSSIAISSFDAATGSRVARFEPIDRINSDVGGVGRQIGFLRAAGDRLVGMTDGTLSVFDPSTGRRWQTEVYDAGALARMQPEHSGLNKIVPTAVAVSEGTIYAIIHEEHQHGHDVSGSSEIVALDDARRAIRWRQPITVSHREWSRIELHLTADAVIARLDGTMLGYDTRDGGELWRTNRADGDLLTDGESLVALQPGRWHVIDLRSGRIVSEHTTSELRGATLHDGILYGFVRDSSGDVLVARHARDGAVVWQSALLPSLRDDGSTTIAELDAVYACEGGSLRAFDRSSGELRFSYGLGGCDLLGVAGGSVIVRSSPQSLPRLSGGQILGFARAAQPIAANRVHASGNVTMECAQRANELVRIGDLLVAADARGHYDAEVLARGTLRIETAPQTALVLGASRVVPYAAYSVTDLDSTPPELTADLDVNLRARCWAQFSYQSCRPQQSACAPTP
jgi:outer membrane protein assembly factor BamB